MVSKHTDFRTTTVRILNKYATASGSMIITGSKQPELDGNITNNMSDTVINARQANIPFVTGYPLVSQIKKSSTHVLNIDICEDASALLDITRSTYTLW